MPVEEAGDVLMTAAALEWATAVSAACVLALDWNSVRMQCTMREFNNHRHQQWLILCHLQQYPWQCLLWLALVELPYLARHPSISLNAVEV